MRSLPARLRAGLCCLGLALLLGGCADLVPQTIQLRSGWPEGVSQKTELSGVPFFPQEAYQCGPAAMATVLGHTGVPGATPEALVSQVYVPARHGSLQVEMLAAPRKWGRVGYLLAPRYADVVREIAAGNAVLVLQDVGEFFQQWHYAVIYGFDYPAGSLFMRSGENARQVMPFTAFERTWMKSGYWAMVVTPPDRVPATATEPGWINAVVGLERGGDREATIAGYRAALQRWPGNLPAAIGLANQHHARGALIEAAAVLRKALQAHPQSTVVMNNLAQTLSDQGRQGEALLQIDQALKLQGPFESEVRSTRQLILERMQRQASAAAR
ncbi:MAG: PA2778 family cysteine peptidase [Burkholderiales bacterium]|nr:PA2778 family cysteine peptidase [Burkholderiales bacterium]